MSKPIQIVVFVVAAVALTGGGFVAGMNARAGGTAKADAAGASPSGGAARRTFGGAGGGGQQVESGRVIAVNGDSITVELRGADGQARSIVALVGGTARIVKTTETQIKASDIKVGDQVLVAGQTDTSSGAVIANAVIDGVSSLQQLFGGGRTGAPSGSGSGFPRRSPAPSSAP